MVLVSVEPVAGSQFVLDGPEEPSLSLRLGIKIDLRSLVAALLQLDPHSTDAPGEACAESHDCEPASVEACGSGKSWEWLQPPPVFTGSRAISNSASDAAGSSIFLESVGLEATLRAMQNSLEDASVQAQGCEALGQISREQRGRANHHKVLAAGGLEATPEAMHKHPRVADVQRQGCRVVGHLSGGLNNPTKEPVLDSAAIELTVKAMREHPSDAGVQHEGCKALRSFGGAIESNSRVITSGGLEATLKAMDEHIDNVGVQSQGCGVIHILANGERGAQPRVTVREAGGLEATLRAMRTHPSDSAIQRMGCMALMNLVHETGNSLVKVAGVRVVVEAMGRHLGDVGVQRHGCILLQKLACDRRCRAWVLDAGGLAAARMAVLEHPGDKCVSQRGRLVLQMLSS